MSMVEEKSSLTFSLPIQFGIKMYVNGIEYRLYAKEGRLSDYLIEMLQNEGLEEKKLSLYDAPEAEERRPLYISFTAKGMCVETEHSARTFAVSYDDFRNEVLKHIKKYALYFVAPYNYQAIMLLPFDEMVIKMKKRQPEADALIGKINLL